MKVKNVAVIGAGTLGRRLAALVSGAGFDTVLEDILPPICEKQRRIWAKQVRTSGRPFGICDSLRASKTRCAQPT